MPLLVESQSEEISLAAILAVLLRHRRLLVLLPLTVAFLWVVISLILPRTYTSEAIFTPTSGTAQLSQLAGLAAQFGVNLPQGETNQSPDFYAALVQSQDLLRSAVETRYRFPASDDPDADTLSGDLVQLFDVDGDGRAVQVAKTIEELQDRLHISTDATTGLVTVDVRTHWAALSRDVDQRLLDLVNVFNLQTRQTQASAERRFLETRVAASGDSLRSMEDSVQSFLEHNRSYQNSPELRFQYDRMNRRLTLFQQVYTTLSESLEQAKIDQVRNTPVITVVGPPQAPARPDRLHLLVKAFVGILLGGVLAVAGAFAAEWARHARRAEPDDYRELDDLWRDTREDVRALWGRVRRAWHGVRSRAAR